MSGRFSRRGVLAAGIAAPAAFTFPAATRAQSLVEACDCRAGCPGCVGPVLDESVPLTEGPRQLALRLLRALQAA